jgi:hypothetical protein
MSFNFKRVKKSLLEMLHGWLWIGGVFVDSIGETALIFLAVLVALVIKNINDLFNLKSNILPLIPFVFLALLVKEIGQGMKEIAYSKRRKR